MNKFLTNVATGIMSTMIIVVGGKIIYNELPKEARGKIEDKTGKVYRAVRDTLKGTMEPV